jgi:mono/diheme cytochrome c family protein
MMKQFAAVLVIAAFAACGGERQGGEAEQGQAQAPAAEQAQPAPAMEAPSGPVDATLAGQGQQAFQTRGCVGCHTIGGGKLVGPDLKGVTARREYGWIVSMITHPDSMIQNDPTARQLYQEYMTPMTPMGATAEDARAIYEYLRQQGQ